MWNNLIMNKMEIPKITNIAMTVKIVDKTWTLHPKISPKIIP